MNILLVPSSFKPNLGGVEEVTSNVAEQLAHCGHEVTVATNKWPATLEADETVFGIRVRRFSFLVPDYSARVLLRFAVIGSYELLKFVLFVASTKPDVIHCVCCSTNLLYCVVASKILGVPLIVSFHGEIGMDASSVYQKKNFLSDSTRRLLRYAKAITACSINTATEVMRYSPESTCSILRNGISIDDFRNPDRSSKPEATDEVTVFALGRLVYQKGFDLLIEAWKNVSFVNAKLVIAGDGPALKSLMSLVSDYKLEHSVSFVGLLDRSAVSRYFNHARAFVLPSRHEPFGLVVLEAMASRTPVIAYAVGGVPEFVTHRKNGFLVTPSDIDQLAGQITAVLQGACTDSILDNAYQTAVSRDWELIICEYLKLYETVINKCER